MFSIRSKNKKFYCRRDNCIVNGCPLGDALADCPLRVDCQAWQESASSRLKAPPAGVPARH